MKYIALLGLLPIVLASPAEGGSSSPQCGVKGYDSKTSAYDYKVSSAVASYAKCGERCSSDNACVSFAFSSSACLLYSVSV